MKGREMALIAGLAAAWALSCFPAAADGAGYKSAAERPGKSAEANGLKKIAVLDFAARGGSGKSEAQYAAEKIGLYLSGSGKTALIERPLLKKLLKEAKLASAAGVTGEPAETLKGMLSLDGVVTGTVYADGETLVVLARLLKKEQEVSDECGLY